MMAMQAEIFLHFFLMKKIYMFVSLTKQFELFWFTSSSNTFVLRCPATGLPCHSLHLPMVKMCMKLHHAIW